MSHLKKKNQTQKFGKERLIDRVREVREIFFLFLLFSLLSSQIHENLTVGFRRANNEKCSMQRGLHVDT